MTASRRRTGLVWIVRFGGVAAVLAAVVLAWAYGPGDDAMIAVPVVVLVLAGYTRVLRAALGPDRGRGDRLLGEAAVAGLGAFVLGILVLLLTFDSN